ncbi:MAG TPA: ADOP family duplicated permease [Bryobacteraceae bacterium]|nr:ADOP family duplicated permease [Bryobacteraceae bacterium]
MSKTLEDQTYRRSIIYDSLTAFPHDLRLAARSLLRTKGLSITVILTLALGIGANAAIFSLVRGVLLRPLVNRDEDRLLYIRHSARGMDADDVAFSVPEIRDLRAGMKSISEFGDFSVIGFTMVGLGEPREVRAGVVGGTYFDVMGLRPVLGRLLGPTDDGPNAAGAAVLTYRFWTTVLKSDPSVLGKRIRLGERTATVVGVLEPSVPYPAETELIANVVTSPHHLSATMVTGRVHRMTELFGRLAPGATIDTVRAELRAMNARMIHDHPEAYSPKAHFALEVTQLRDQINSRASTVLWILLASSLLIFVIACSNVANLILARSVQREGELAVRAALGASPGALRRTLLAESLLLCLGGAIIGVLIARPMVAILGRYASRFSVRALDITVDSSMLWVGALLAVAAAVMLAFVPRLPASDASRGLSLSGSSLRIAGGTNRRLRIFAMIQIAASFVLLAGATALVTTLLNLQSVNTGFDTRHVLALNVPVMSYGKTPQQIAGLYKESIRRIKQLPGVDAVAVGTIVPWRDAGAFGPGFLFSADGHVRAPGEEDPRGRFRSVSPGFFASLGVPIVAGRDFNDADSAGKEMVVIVSQSLAQRMFPNQDAVNRHIMWTDPIMKFIDVSTAPRRIVGVAADVDDENVEPSPALTIYQPFEQANLWGGRMFVHTHVDPHPLISPVTRIIRGLSVEQPVEHAATLADIRAEVLTPNRLNALVFGVFAGVALAIAVVGVAGVLAFSVSRRIREFGIRLAIGSQSRQLLGSVVKDGALMAAAGIVAGAICGFALERIAASYLSDLKMPGIVPIIGSGFLLLIAAIIASALPAARAARIDVMEALRSE